MHMGEGTNNARAVVAQARCAGSDPPAVSAFFFFCSCTSSWTLISSGLLAAASAASSDSTSISNEVARLWLCGRCYVAGCGSMSHMMGGEERLLCL